MSAIESQITANNLHEIRRHVYNSGVSQCHEYLVSGPRGVPDGQLSASSQETISSNAHRGRLYTGTYKYPNGYYLEGAWTADPADTQPWLQASEHIKHTLR